MVAKIPSDFADKMVQYRARNDINQDEMARRCKVTVQTINCIENRRRETATRLTIAKIGDVIGYVNES